MNKIRQTPRSRRLSAYDDKHYVIPKLFLSVDLYKKQQHSVKIVSNQDINYLTFFHRNKDYQSTKRSVQPYIEQQSTEENNKAYEVKIQIKFVKHKSKPDKQLRQDFQDDYKIVKFPNTTKNLMNDEIELSRKLQRLISTIAK